VRLATHYGFRPDFCEAADPESKGVVEALVGYAKADLVVPDAAGWDGLADANAAAVAWCAEVNARTHSQTCAVPTSGWRPNGTCWVRCRACARRCAVASLARSIGWRPCGSARPAIRSRRGWSA
jgi:hypothetical protein